MATTRAKKKPVRSKRANETAREMAATAGPTAAPPDWRTQVLDRVRALIGEADPQIVEEVKWRKPSNDMAGVAAWSRNGLVCTGETYKDKVKLTFAKGAAIDDPAGLFNASLDGGTRRAIDLREGETLNPRSFKALIRAAVKLNVAKSPARTPSRGEPSRSGASRKSQPIGATTASKPAEAPPRLLSGGNPQIAKAYGNEPVQAFIAAMPGWKRDIGLRLDAIIERTVPGVNKAVKWNSPLYGVEGQGWFLSFHCFARYVKVAFLRGDLLRPLPPGESKTKHTRYLDIHEHDSFDEARFARWVKQASRLPGEHM